MKKLESLKSFSNNKLHEKQMSMISGGASATGKATVGSCKASASSQTGYIAYTSDIKGENDTTTYYGISEISKCDSASAISPSISLAPSFGTFSMSKVSNISMI